MLYDGDCGLCDRVVRALLRADKAGRLHYTSLQSAPAQEYLRTQGLPTTDFKSLVFVSDWNRPLRGAYRVRTDGALSACAVVGGGLWRMVGWTRFIPRILRDGAYKLVARSRYALFGKYRPTPLPDPAWGQRFLVRPITRPD
ncbi:MAG: DUF393 domain-containing protein [Opitutae bacterium]|nr:DUF393 domain-containing protein [Opitutae bacterium]